MNPKAPPELTVQTLMALRTETDAVRIITERLKVKEMGPADHIRTKHEVKAFVESGDVARAGALLTSAQTRRELNERQDFAQKLQQKRGQRIVY